MSSGMLDELGMRRVEGKTLTFFSPEGWSFAALGLMHIDLLLNEAQTTPNGNARICLHSSPEALHHDMICVERRGNYFPPHRHSNKSETLTVLRGQLRIHIFHLDGEERHCQLISRGGICRIEPQVFHFTTPASDFVVYQESKPGPFLGEADREFAPWVDEALRQRLLLEKAPQ